MTENKICVLDDHTANQIAAGEVVERPSSVVKELVENAVDAQSRRITVEIRDGGVDFIRVSDDGEGMSPIDAQFCLLRHATSKIRAADDLLRLCTLGFRGEALPSIASVSRLTIVTRQGHAQWATQVQVKPGCAPEVREIGGELGTTVTVEDLFYNTPARRKFLRTTATEVTYITDMLSRLAVSRPDIAFVLINNERTVFMTPGSGNELEAVGSVYGHRVQEQVLPLTLTTSSEEACGAVVSGYIGKPSLVKSSRQWQTVIVNGRVISNKMLSRAIDQSFHSLLPAAGHPFAIIHIQIPAEQVDVNVHPQKAEIKFADERSIFRLVHKTIRDRLILPSETPLEGSKNGEFSLQRLESVAYPSYAQTDLPTFTQYSAGSLASDKGAAYLPVQRDSDYVAEQTANFVPEAELPPLLLEVATGIPTKEFSTGILSPRSEGEQILSGVADSSALLRPLGQLEQKYIIAVSNNELYLIDQHAAHERIVYERLANRSKEIPGQQLLVPIIVDISLVEEELLEKHQDLWREFRFSCSLAGPGKLRIDELPADIDTCEAEPLIREIFAHLKDHHRISLQELRHLFLQTAACHGAIRAGQALSLAEMRRLLDDLAALHMPYTCPHGRPCVIRFGSNDLSRMFKRT